MFGSDDLSSLAGRAREVRPFLVMEILERAQALEAAGRDVIHLEIGEPDLPTPARIIEAAKRALDEGHTRYTHSQGSIELRSAICAHFDKRYGVEIGPEQILVTSGTSAAMMLAFGMLLDAGDEAVMTDPYYACYPNFIRFLGGVPRFALTHVEKGFELEGPEVARSLGPRTKTIVVNSPANPTGTVLSLERLQELADLNPRGSVIISDEIYHGLSYGGRDHTMLELTDRCIVLNGFSKAYAMTGWRLGYMILPKDLARAAQVLQQNFYISANNFIQSAAVVALTECADEQEQMRQTFDERRRFLLSALPATGLKVHHEPLGAFYVLADAKEFCDLGAHGSSYELALDILERTGVALTPGSDFGSKSEGFLRISYASSIEQLTEAVSRLKEYFGMLRG